MKNRRSRREFMKLALASPLMPALLKGQSGSNQSPAPVKVFLEPFNYNGVRLLDGMLQKQFQSTRDFYFNLPDDNLVKDFRARARLESPGKDLLGWYAGDPGQVTWWSKGDTFNAFGQYLSGMARMAKATGDSPLLEKATRLMREWAKPSSRVATSITPESRTRHITSTKRPCADWRTCTSMALSQKHGR